VPAGSDPVDVAETVRELDFDNRAPLHASASGLGGSVPGNTPG
jgi:hypothetical protein